MPLDLRGRRALFPGAALPHLRAAVSTRRGI